ncbi:hypothetical protein ACFQ08_08605 [Streptosporangium algeriense]|uniref:Uncharacterized protein n=1 Tax=Streptosporangium algeriense TaxID=1682748 RepID=A0ABW3DNN5_9ACTN
MIRDWFRTRAALIRRLNEADRLLEEAREECVELASASGRDRGAVLRQAATIRALESRLDVLQRANMARDRVR